MTYREEGTYVVIDVDIITLATTESFDPVALEATLNATLSTVVSDGEIGNYNVDTLGSVTIEAAVTGD